MLDLYEHQADAVKRLGTGKILWGPVGSGKSITAVSYYIQKEAPRDVFVITTAKKRDELDWEEEFAKAGVGKTVDSTVAGVLYVDSWNNLKKYEEIQNAFFIFDEQRLVGSGAWVKSFLKIAKHNNWIMLSATPGDTWVDYIPVFVANGFYKNRTEFITEHVIYKAYRKFPTISRFVGVGRLVRHRNDILVSMPYQTHTTRHVKTWPVTYDQSLMDQAVKKRWNPFEGRPLTNVAELFSVVRRIVNSSPDRLTQVKNLMKKHPRLIVFYNFDYERDILLSIANGRTEPESLLNLSVTPTETGWTSTKNTSAVAVLGTTSRRAKVAQPSGVTVVAEYNGHRHDPVPKADRWVYLVQYAAGAEGWNCIDTDAMVFWSLTYSYKMWHQAHGRIDRLNTPFKDLFYYVLLSNSFIDKAVMHSLNTKKSFNEKALVDSFSRIFS